jgi:hypothetical protein
MNRLNLRRALWAAGGVVVALGISSTGALATTDGGVRHEATRLHFLVKESFNVIERAPKGPSNGDVLYITGDLLDPKTQKVVGYEAGKCLVVDAANQARAVCDIVFTPRATTALSGAEKVTAQGIFDDVPTPDTVAITGGTGRYVGARGQIRAKEAPNGLLDIVIELR